MHASKSNMDTNFKIEVLTQLSHSMPEMHYHDFYEIYIQDHGERDHIVSNHYYKLSPKEILLLKPNILHQSISADPHTRTIIYLNKELLSSYFKEDVVNGFLLPFQSYHLSLNNDEYYELSNLVRKLSKENINYKYNHICTSLGELLLLLCQIWEQSITPSTKGIDNPDSILSPLVSYVHENYLVLDNIDKIANTFYMTKSHMCRTFKKDTGLTIIEYIHNLKIQRACQLLKTTPLSITDVALDSGFNSTMYFCRIFKSIVKITPSQFRKLD